MCSKLIVSLYDKKADFYSPPTLADTAESARRMFLDLTLDKKTLVGMHPEDFVLWHIGDYDSALGDVHPIDHKLLMDGNSLIQEQV